MDRDFFALLGSPRSLVLDEEALRDCYHAAAARAENPAELHSAYTTLRDPARRIDHLLQLSGKTSAAQTNPGSSLFDLFFSVNAALKSADSTITSLLAAQSALQRAGLAGRLISSLGDLTDTAGDVHRQNALRHQQLISLQERFPELDSAEWSVLASLGSDFSFLGKWKSEIRKRETRLQEMLIGQMA